MSVSKIRCATTRMFNGKLIVVRVGNMLSCFPPSMSSELLGTAHTHLPSFPLTASSLLFPSCSFVHPSQQCCPLQEQHALLLIESNLQLPFSCILLKSPPPPLQPTLPLLLSRYSVTVRGCGNTRSLSQEVQPAEGLQATSEHCAPNPSIAPFISSS